MGLKMCEMKNYPQYPKICVIGAGLSGMCAGIKLIKEFGHESFTIYDENEEFGGTWFLHKYPNCACDVPSIFYSFSFEPNPGWSSLYPKQPEILDYLVNIAKKHDLYSRTKFNHLVQSFCWIEEEMKWKVSVLDKVGNAVRTEYFDFIIAGPGPFRVPNIPEVYKNFKGPLMHSMEWDEKVDLEGKKVAVVGSGTSAIQIIPGIVDSVKELIAFQRRPAWVTPKPNLPFSKAANLALQSYPILQTAARSFFYGVHESTYPFFKKDSWANFLASYNVYAHLRYHYPNKPELRAKLTPNYPFGSKRLGISNDYYPALGKDHVKVVNEDVKNVGENFIITEDGEKYEVDVIILATGYRQMSSAYMRPVKAFNDEEENVDEMEKFRKTPNHYLGIMTSSMPNLFFLLGPNSAALHSSNVFTIEYQMDWTLSVLNKLLSEGKHVVSVKQEEEEKYMTQLHKDLEGNVCGNTKDSGTLFNENTGSNTLLHPGALTHYWVKVRSVNFDHLNMH